MMRALELKIPPLLVVLVFASIMLIVDVMVPFSQFSPDINNIVSSLFLLSGIVVVLAGIIGFYKAQTTVNPTTPEATSIIVTTGIYRFSRNPMYLGFLLILIAWAIYLSNILACIFPPAFIAYMNCFQISAEEKALSEKFGDIYFDYKEKVRRWM